MIIRVVRMEVIDTKLELFNHFMDNVKEVKTELKGCIHYDVLRDKRYANVFYGYTIWEAENDLVKYRKSELFKETVRTVNQFCVKKSQAWTVENVFDIPASLN